MEFVFRDGLHQPQIEDFISSARLPIRILVFLDAPIRSEARAVDVIHSSIFSSHVHLHCLSGSLWIFTSYLAYFHIFRNFPGTCPDLMMMPEHSAFPSTALRCLKLPACYCVCRWTVTSWFKPSILSTALSLFLPLIRLPIRSSHPQIT